MESEVSSNLILICDIYPQISGNHIDELRLLSAAAISRSYPYGLRLCATAILIPTGAGTTAAGACLRDANSAQRHVRPPYNLINYVLYLYYCIIDIKSMLALPMRFTYSADALQGGEQEKVSRPRRQN